jgi:hypothetical protein
MYLCDQRSRIFGFQLTAEGIQNALQMISIHEVWQFLGLCNFFRGHVRNFTQLTAPLTSLTKKDCTWK